MDDRVPARRRWLAHLTIAWIVSWGTALAALSAWVYLVPFPTSWLQRGGEGSVLVVDRHGEVLRHASYGQGRRQIWLPRQEIPEPVVTATLAGEDHRFEAHAGVDPWAVVRAARLNLEHGRIYSGASTLTMQLVRMVDPGPTPKTFTYKARQALLALRLEATMDKDQIIEHYLNRAPYGNNAVGIEAASRHYFHKPAAKLTLAQAAFLSALPRAPSRYNPRKTSGMARAQKRQRHILGLMRERGQIDEATWEEAVSEPIALAPRAPAFAAPHFVDRHLPSPRERAAGARRVETTLDKALQARAARQVRYRLQMLPDGMDAQAGAVIMDVESGEVLAMVGSRGWSEADGGQFNAATAARPVGTTLLPLLYATAFEQGMSPATVLADVPELVGPRESPRVRVLNRDGIYRGPTSARVALVEGRLAASVDALRWAGFETFAARARSIGVELDDPASLPWSLERPARDGRVSLLTLVAMHATFARGGAWRPPREVRRTWLGGEVIVEPPLSGQLLDPRAAWLTTDVLADEGARVDAMGAGRAPLFDYPAAVSVHTDDGSRDLWAFATTGQVAVGVWVGRFDGRPLPELTAATGPMPLMRDLLEVAMRDYTPGLAARPEGLVEVAVCPLSGLPPGPDCPHQTRDHALAGSAPKERCDWHLQLPVDRRNGRLATWACEDREPLVAASTFARLPGHYAHWRRHKALGGALRGLSPLCEPGGEDHFYPPVVPEPTLTPQWELEQARRRPPPGVASLLR